MTTCIKKSLRGQATGADESMNCRKNVGQKTKILRGIRLNRCHITATQADQNDAFIKHQAAYQIFMYKDESTQISASGLRYLVKENGSPFKAMGAPGETRSCIKCGEHKARSKGSIKRYLNALMFFCFDCRPVKNMP